MTLSESAGEKSLNLWFLEPLLMAQEIVGTASSDVLYILHSLLHCCKSSVLGLPGVLAKRCCHKAERFAVFRTTTSD